MAEDADIGAGEIIQFQQGVQMPADGSPQPIGRRRGGAEGREPSSFDGK
jgi:hypothetical protein